MSKKSKDLSSLPVATPEYHQKIYDEMSELLSAIDLKSGQKNSILSSPEFIEKMKKDDEIQNLFSEIIQHHPLSLVYLNEQKTLQIPNRIQLKRLITTLSEESVWHFLFMNYLNEDNETQYLDRITESAKSHNKSFYSHLPSTITQSSTFLQSFNSPFGAKVLSKVMPEFKDKIMIELFTHCSFDLFYHPALANVVFSEQNIKKNPDIFKKMALKDVQELKNNCCDFYSDPLLFSSLDPQDTAFISKLYPVASEILIRNMYEYLPDRGFMKDYMSSKIHEYFWLWSGDLVWSFTSKRMTWEEIRKNCLFFENENIGYEYTTHNPEETSAKIAYLKNELLVAHAEHGGKEEFAECVKSLDKLSAYTHLEPADLNSFEIFLARNPIEFKSHELNDYNYQPFQSKATQALNLWMPDFKKMDDKNRAVFDELLLFTAYHSPGTLYHHSQHLMDWIQDTSLDNKKRLQRVFLTHLVLGDSVRLLTGMNYQTAVTWDAWTYRPQFANYLFDPALFPEVKSSRHPFLNLSADIFNKINLWDDFIAYQKTLCEQERPWSVRTLPYLGSYRAQLANALHLPHTVKNIKEVEAKPKPSLNRF